MQDVLAFTCFLTQVGLPASWDVARAQAYFGWASEVINSIRGTNAALEAELVRVFEGDITVDGKSHPCILAGYQAGDWKIGTPQSD